MSMNRLELYFVFYCIIFVIRKRTNKVGSIFVKFSSFIKLFIVSCAVPT